MGRCHYKGFVTGNVPHGYESQYGGAYRKYCCKREYCIIPESVCPLEEIDADYNLVSYQDESVEVAHAHLSDSVAEHEDGRYAEDGAYKGEYGCKGEVEVGIHCYVRDGHVASGESYHRCEKHGNEQPCCNH